MQLMASATTGYLGWTRIETYASLPLCALTLV